jgi:hypothetical protein
MLNMRWISCLGMLAFAALFGIAVRAAAVSGDEALPGKNARAKGDHWAFRPVVRPEPPVVRGPARTDIDRFILAPLEARNETLNPDADRLTLIRRVSFDLIGLPPTLAEIDEFLADGAPDAYERLVDRCLASPHYGERWGKYWLDAAGYADSNGYFDADSDRPHAWRYRDYVIAAVNADKPYDRFVQEQLAGDELAGYLPDGDITPETATLLTATHFLRNAPDGTGESDGNPDEVRTDRFTVLEGNLQNAMNCLLGVTIQCARCHSHKFEPISQNEYYQLQAIYFPAYNPERWKTPKDRVLQAGTKAERAHWRQLNDAVDRQVKALEAGLTAVAAPLKDQLLHERLRDLDFAARDDIVKAVNTPKEKRTAPQKALLDVYAKAVAVDDNDLTKRFPEYAALRDQTKKTIAARTKDRPAELPKLSVFVETDPKPVAHHLLRRGQHNQPADEVQPGVLTALSTPRNLYAVEPPPPGRISTGRRSALARWMTSPENPLFARVMVNRVWQHHFGTGLVATADNLGRSGARPSHPELVDYLAAAFVRGGWSMKALHRAIMTSSVYRQTSTPRPSLAKIDPENRLLGSFPLRRLDAEALRDAMLLVTGELDRRSGGPYVPSKRAPDGVIVPEDQPGAKRRSVYLQQRRTQVVTFLQLFDAPAIVATCSARPTSTVPLQALALLNSPFARARADAFARRLQEETADTEKRLALGYRLACARPPMAEELQAAGRFLTAQQQLYRAQKDGELRAWTDLCQMILASNAFLYVE